MDLTSPNTKSSPTPPPTSQPEAAESNETATALPSRIQTTKHLSFTNGVLKRHQQQHHHNHHHHHHHHPIVITYRECLKNHAASIGGHALDGCGEFMPSPTATATDPTSLKCAACGCHRNFHRRDPDDINTATNNTTAVLAATAGNNNNHHTATIEYQPHHRHHPPPPPTQPIPNPPPSNRSPNSSSPPPISSSYYPSAPHMLLALSGSLQPSEPVFGSGSGFGSSRKRFRTKFSQTQKEKMYEFAERVGWKMQKRDEEIVNEFCNEVGVDRTVLKVWMHNNKNTFGRQLQNQQTQTHSATNGSIIRAINLENNSEDKKKDGEEEEEEDGEDNNNNGEGGGLNRHFESVAAVNGGGGGSSSSS